MFNETVIVSDTAARLKGNTGAADRVFEERTSPLPDEDLPALVLFIDSHEEVNDSIHVPAMRQVLNLMIEGTVTADTDKALLNEIGALAHQVKQRLMTDPDWVKQFEQIERITTSRARDTDSDRRRASFQMQFVLRAATEIYEPVIPDDLEQVHVDVDMIDPGDGPDGESELEIDIPVEPPT